MSYLDVLKLVDDDTVSRIQEKKQLGVLLGRLMKKPKISTEINSVYTSMIKNAEREQQKDLGVYVPYPTMEVALIKWAEIKDFGLIWRASVMSDPTVDYYMICDADSRLNFYFKFAFEEMLKQNKTFFRFIDLPKHTSPNPYTIYGCGYGGKANIINNIEFQSR